MKLNQNFTPTVTMANITLPTSSAKIMSSNAAGGNCDTFKYKGSAYQVPTGKKLIIWAMRQQTVGAAGGVLGFVAYGDTAVSNSATGPTNSVQIPMGGAYTYPFVVKTQYDILETPAYFEIPAGKFPYMANAANAYYAEFLCEEVSA